MVTVVFLLHFIRAVVTKRNGKGLRNTDVRFCNVGYMLLAEEYQWTWYYLVSRDARYAMKLTSHYL